MTKARHPSESPYWRICDAAGFYDEFTTADLRRWFPAMKRHAIHQHVRTMVLSGGVERVGYGVYRWLPKRKQA